MNSNLGYFTDSFFLEEDKKIIHYPDVTFVCSPNQPTFFYGNFLYLNNALSKSDKDKLEKEFRKLFTDPKIKHFTFCWSGNDTSGIQPFIDAGYKLEEISVLKAEKKDILPLQLKNEEILISPFNSKKDWGKWVKLELEEREEGYSEEGYRIYLEGRVEVYQKLNQKGQGNFYGAYLNDELIAAAGLFHQNKIGRFQMVRTKETHRKKGICKTLIHHMCQEGFQQADTLVIAADKGYYALGIYERMGFKSSESQTSVFYKEVV